MFTTLKLSMILKFQKKKTEKVIIFQIIHYLHFYDVYALLTL